MIKLLICEDVMHTTAALSRAERNTSGGALMSMCPPQLDLEPNQNHDVSALDSAVLSVVVVRRPQKSSIKL